MPSRCRPCLSVFALTLTLALTGCALTGTAPPSPVIGAALQGTIHGGQSPIAGAHIYLYAANTTGYNTTGATNASVSLLNNVPGSTTQDGNGNYYVTSDSGGNFSITSDYTCTPDSGSVPGQQVYLYAIGGSQGGVANAASGLMAVLGDCPAAGTFAGTIPSLVMNEVTTVAAAYAMAGFAYDATHVSSSGTTLAKTGVKNAFANAGNLVNIVTGTAYATTPAGNGTVPQATIYTLANILAACINSNGAVTGPTTPTTCYTLFNSAESSGSSGTVPSDTATAAINIAHNPGANVATLYGLPSTVPPFSSALSTQPNDLSLGIVFSGGKFNWSPGGQTLTIDGSGNVRGYGGQFSSLGVVSTWTSSCSVTLSNAEALDPSGNLWTAYWEQFPQAAAYITEFDASGTCLRQFATTPFITVGSIVVDGSGNIWIDSPSALLKYSSTGTDLSGSTGFVHNTVNGTSSIAFDTSGNAWLSNGNGYIHKFNSSGVLQTPTVGWPTNTASNGDTIYAIAVDASGTLWSANEDPSGTSGSNLYETMTATDTSTASFKPVTLTGNPIGLAFDGAGNVVMAGDGGCIAKISPTTHNTLTGTTGCIQAPGTGESMALDGSGDLWLGTQTLTAQNQGQGQTVEMIGFTAPVVTPLALAVKNSAIGTRP